MDCHNCSCGYGMYGLSLWLYIIFNIDYPHVHIHNCMCVNNMYIYIYTPTTCKYTNHLRFLGPASPLGYPQDLFQDRQLVKSLSNGKTFFGEKRLRSVAEALQGFTMFPGWQ